MLDASRPETNLLLSFILLLVIAGLTAYYADRKGRNAFLWFVIGVLLGVIAPIILYFLPSPKAEEPNKPSGVVYPPAPPSDEKQSVEQSVMPLENDRLWYYLDGNHQQYGPVSVIALKDLWDTGTLDLNSFVWTEGMEKWDRVDNLPKLKEKFKHYLG